MAEDEDLRYVSTIHILVSMNLIPKGPSSTKNVLLTIYQFPSPYQSYTRSEQATASGGGGGGEMNTIRTVSTSSGNRKNPHCLVVYSTRGTNFAFRKSAMFRRLEVAHFSPQCPVHVEGFEATNHRRAAT
jgi:hypothetical protein